MSTHPARPAKSWKPGARCFGGLASAELLLAAAHAYEDLEARAGRYFAALRQLLGQCFFLEDMTEWCAC